MRAIPFVRSRCRRRTKRTPHPPTTPLPPRNPPALSHDGGVSTPAHLVQTGKIIVEERRRRSSPCATHTRRPGFSSQPRPPLGDCFCRVSQCDFPASIRAEDTRPGKFIWQSCRPFILPLVFREYYLCI